MCDEDDCEFTFTLPLPLTFNFGEKIGEVISMWYETDENGRKYLKAVCQFNKEAYDKIKDASEKR